LPPITAGGNERSAALVASALALVGRQAVDLALDGEQGIDALDCLDISPWGQPRRFPDLRAAVLVTTPDFALLNSSGTDYHSKGNHLGTVIDPRSTSAVIDPRSTSASIQAIRGAIAAMLRQHWL
jgi:hypothetical protein